MLVLNVQDSPKPVGSTEILIYRFWVYKVKGVNIQSMLVLNLQDSPKPHFVKLGAQKCWFWVYKVNGVNIQSRFPETSFVKLGAQNY